MLLSGDPTLIYVGTDRFLPQAPVLSRSWRTRDERTRVAGIDSVDLRFDESRSIGRARSSQDGARFSSSRRVGRPAATDDSRQQR